MTIYKNLKWKMVESTLKIGDIAIFESTEYINESAKEAFETYKRIYQKGITLIFLNNSYLNTSVYEERVGGRPTIKNFDIPEDGKFRMIMEDAEETFERVAEHCFFMVFECLLDKAMNPQGLIDYYERLKEDLSRALDAVKEAARSQQAIASLVDRNTYCYIWAKNTADDLAALVIIVSLFFNTILSYMKSMFAPVLKDLQLG